MTMMESKLEGGEWIEEMMGVATALEVEMERVSIEHYLISNTLYSNSLYIYIYFINVVSLILIENNLLCTEQIYIIYILIRSNITQRFAYCTYYMKWKLAAPPS